MLLYINYVSNMNYYLLEFLMWKNLYLYNKHYNCFKECFYVIKRKYKCTCLATFRSGVSNSEWLASRMRLKERSHWKKWKNLPSNFYLKTKNSWKNSHIVSKFFRKSIIFRCSRAAFDPLGSRVFETAALDGGNLFNFRS